MGHPAPGGDVDTFVYLSPETWHMIVPDGVVPLTADVTGHMQVTHRRLLVVATHDSEPMLIEEVVVTLLAAAVSPPIAQIAAATGFPDQAHLWPGPSAATSASRRPLSGMICIPRAER